MRVCARVCVRVCACACVCVCARARVCVYRCENSTRKALDYGPQIRVANPYKEKNLLKRYVGLRCTLCTRI